MKQKTLKWAAAVAFAALVWGTVFLLCGCTVLPDTVQGAAGGYSGNEGNSGVVASTAAGIELTAAAEARYEALVDRYSKGLPSHPFLPVLTRKAGVTALPNGHYVLDREHFADFSLMASWARSGRTP